MRLSANTVISRNFKMMMMKWRLFKMMIRTKKRCKESSKKTRSIHQSLKMKIKMMMMKKWKMKIWKRSKKRERKKTKI